MNCRLRYERKASLFVKSVKQIYYRVSIPSHGTSRSSMRSRQLAHVAAEAVGLWDAIRVPSSPLASVKSTALPDAPTLPAGYFFPL